MVEPVVVDDERSGRSGQDDPSGGAPRRGPRVDLSLDDADRRTALTVAGGTLAVTVFLFILYPAAVSVLVLGGILGMLTAILAFGLVLIYRANGVINFAQGDLGGVAAVLAGSMIVAYDMPFFAAVAIAFVVAVVLGGLIEILVIRRFSNAPRLVLTVATFGIAQLLQVAQLALPQLFDFNVTPPTPEPFKVNLEWFPVVFKGGHVLIALAVPAMAAGLALFFRRSRAGVGIRAAAESTARASLLGIPVKRLNTLVWVLAAALSAGAALLRVPIQGVSIGAVFDPSLLLLALAAAVFGRMESLPRTFAASIVLGMISQSVLNITGQTVIVDGVVFAVILAVLLLQRGGVERARDTGMSSWGATKEVRPIPKEMRSLPQVKYPLQIAGGVIAAFLLFAPLRWSAPDVNLFSVGIIFAMVIVSLVVLTGWAGQITLGHLALVAFGSAVTGVLAQQGRHFFVCLAASILTGVFVSLAIGVPALRIRGLFYAVTSLAFAVATGTFLLNPKYFGWLVPDPASTVTRFRPILFDKFDMDSEYTYYYVCLFFLILTVAVVTRLRSSRTGRVLIANRDNTRAAQSYGISANRAQLTAFGISGGIAGLAGSLFFFHQRAVSGSLLAPNENFILFSIAVVGGLASVPGALLGAAYFTLVKYSGVITSTQGQLFASGFGVLLVLLVLPNGLGGLLYDLRDRALRTIASRKGMVVPSLLADVRIEDAEVAELDSADTTLVDATLVFDEPPAGPATTLSQPSDDPLILVRGLEVAYGKTQVLFGVDFHVERGEIVALLGTNGAGKSTLLSAMTGLVAPMSGSVTFDGHDLTGADAGVVVREGMVLMPGGKGVFPTLTVKENLELAGWIHDDQQWVADKIEEVLEIFPRLRERIDQKAGNMSGGEQQMLTLGQALILEPKVLFIDELSLGLAPIIVEQLLGIVREIHAQGTTIVLVEQSVNVAIALAQRAVFMEKGEVRFDGPTSDLLDRPEILRAVFLQGAAAKDDVPPDESVPKAPARPRGQPVSAGAAGVGSHRFDGAPCPCGREHPVLLELADLAVNFGGVRAVDGVTFEVRQEQIVGMIGPNGAGKTTIFDLISGFVTPTGGRVRLGGTDVTNLSPSGRAMLGLGRSFQDARLFSAMTVRETIATALERHVKVRDPLAAIVLSPAVRFSEKEVTDEVETLIELMNLQAFADKFVGELSTGSRRIVDIACSLAHRPDVLLLDEPSSGIAQRETEALGPVIQNIRDQLGAAIVVIEHDMPLITGISDQLIALELGAVIAQGEPQAVVTDARVVEGYLGGTTEVINRSGPTS